MSQVHIEAGLAADSLIAAEIGRQDRMWGIANDRADATEGQLLKAGIAQAVAIDRVLNGQARTAAFDCARGEYYPLEWGGFRDYGSDVANLVVAVAFLRQEIKRRIANGEDMTRTARNPATQPFTGDFQPVVIEP